jgi:hypothetical protein
MVEDIRQTFASSGENVEEDPAAIDIRTSRILLRGENLTPSAAVECQVLLGDLSARCSAVGGAVCERCGECASCKRTERSKGEGMETHLGDEDVVLRSRLKRDEVLGRDLYKHLRLEIMKDIPSNASFENPRKGEGRVLGRLRDCYSHRMGL